MPSVEFPAFENPCSEVALDYKSVLENLGVDFPMVLSLAKCYDSLRKTRRQSVVMHDHNNDKALA